MMLLAAVKGTVKFEIPASACDASTKWDSEKDCTLLLKDLRQNVAQLKGLGTKACQNLSRLQIHHISELLQHYPGRYLDHVQPVSLAEIYQPQTQDSPPANERYLYCLVQVLEHSYIPWRGTYRKQQHDPHAGRALKILVQDTKSEHSASLLCFGRNFLSSQLPVGSYLLLAGKFQLRYGELQCSNFNYERLNDLAAAQNKRPVAAESGAYTGGEFGCILPLYPLTQGISQKQLRNAIAQALQHFSFSLEDELPEFLRQQHQLLNKKEALRQIHFPASSELLRQAHRSLVYEELLLLMLLIRRRRLQQHRQLQDLGQNQDLSTEPPAAEQGPAETQTRAQQSPARTFSLPGPGKCLGRAEESLPFRLSKGQREVLDEILHSFGLDVPMNRLLQGDVGSGKSIVALLSALPWLEVGAQVVLMAPTEILARQLQQNFEQLRRQLEQKAPECGIRIAPSAFLAASQSASRRREILSRLRSAEIQLLVGTHALFSQAVEFPRLRYIIVDEQHRFGVEQRLALKHKASRPPHVLLMSATPIPRTLALTLYGDLDISSIHSLPARRKPVKTHLVRQGNDPKMYQFILRELEAGHQVYFVYPLIREEGTGTEERVSGSESLQDFPGSQDAQGSLRSIEQMARHLQQVFGRYRLAVIHGQLPAEQKEAGMKAFRANQVQILLATTVVEVGLDVPNASVMVIEHAERFGLAQLHQLRGRVGRGESQGYCFLVYQDDESHKLSTLAKERLLTLKNSNDGFAIAEKDLELRGPGDLLGAEQSGSMALRLARIPEDMEQLELARTDAAAILQEDYALLQAQHQGLRRVLMALGQEGLDA